MTKIIAFSGSYSRGSKTFGLLDAIAGKASACYGIEVAHYDMQALGPSLGRAWRQDELDSAARAIIEEISRACALIVGVPVYKGSYPGLFKHFIDLMDPEQLEAKPVILAASGGGDRHALVVEHQLRPLFGFFMAHTLPTALYAAARDYDPGNRIISPELLGRIDKAVDQLAPFLRPYALNGARNGAHFNHPRAEVIARAVQPTGELNEYRRAVA